MSPEIRAFESNTFLPSLVISHLEKDQVITKRRDIQDITSHLDDIRTIETDLIGRLGNDPADESTRKYLQVIVDRLFMETRQWLKFIDFDPLLYKVTLGIPSDWDGQDSAIQSLREILQQAGFRGIEIANDAIAAIKYHLYSSINQLPYYKEQAQSWLVIDLGDKSARFTCVEHLAGASEMRVRASFQSDWGGDRIDEALYENFLLPKYWTAPGPPNEKIKECLLLMIRELKEKFSAKLIHQDTSSINFQIEGVQDPVELSESIFESKDGCQQLIEQFPSVLNDSRLNTDPGFQGVERVVLVGGGANWYFVKEAAHNIWPGLCVYALDPELTIVKGLALVGTSFEPKEPKDIQLVGLEKDENTGEKQELVEVIEKTQPVILPRLNSNGRQGPDKSYPIIGYFKLGQQSTIHGQNQGGTWWYIKNPDNQALFFWVAAEITRVIGDTANVPVVQAQSLPGVKLKQLIEIHKKARQLILWCTIAGAAIALLLSPIPGASAPFLIGLEIFMFLKIANAYVGYKIEKSTIILVAIGLVVMSTILTILIGDILGTIAWAVGLGWLVKMAVAAVVIWGLGEGAIYILDKIGKAR